MREIAVLCRQAGTAAGLLPVIRALNARGDRCTTFAHEHAVATCRAAGLRPRPLAPFDELQSLLDELAPSIVITGTSLDVADDDAAWRWARARRIPSLAFVDSWVNLAQRFHRDAPFDALPDVVAVIDESCASALADAGCPRERIAVLGHPTFDGLADRAAEHGSADALRAELLGQDSERLLVTFVSEPIAQTVAHGARSPGYTEVDALGCTLRALERMGPRALVALKLHPRESTDAHAPIRTAVVSGRSVRAEIVDADRHDLALASDLVFGMTSMLLREAAALGRRVISVQPNQLYPSPVIAGDPRIRVATDEDALVAAIAQSLKENALVPLERSVEATPRFLALIDDFGAPG